MNAKVRIIIFVAAFCAMIAGCRNNSVVRVDQQARVATDIRIIELQKQLDTKWENPRAHYEIGQLYHAQGDYSKAEWHYNLALGFNPAYRDVQAAIVKLQLDKGDKSKADWIANSYMAQVVSTPEQILALGSAFEKQGLDGYAFKCYTDALRATPDSPAVNKALGYYYLQRSKKDQAKEYFIRSFQINPNQADVAGELGRLGVVVRIPQPPTQPKAPSTTRPQPPESTPPPPPK